MKPSTRMDSSQKHAKNFCQFLTIEKLPFNFLNTNATCSKLKQEYWEKSDRLFSNQSLVKIIYAVNKLFRDSMNKQSLIINFL